MVSNVTCAGAAAIAGALAACAAMAAPPRFVTAKIVKTNPARAATQPAARFSAAAGSWRVRREITFSGENDREIFFTFERMDPAAPLPRVEITAPGVEPLRVIVGRRDVPFRRGGDVVAFDLIDDGHNNMQMRQLLADPHGGLPIHFDHNSPLRQDGWYRGRPFPLAEARACGNWLLAARECLRLTGGMGPEDKRNFAGDVVLMSFETACARGHKDFPPHVHIMLWVPGYSGSEIPHFYMDGRGRIVNCRFDIIGPAEGPRSDQREAIIREKKKREGVYEPGRPLRLLDLEGRAALELTITADGGLLVGRPDGAEPYLLIGDDRGPDEAVLVRRGGRTLLRARMTDDVDSGLTTAIVEYLAEEPPRTLRTEWRYDPFTGAPATKEP